MRKQNRVLPLPILGAIVVLMMGCLIGCIVTTIHGDSSYSGQQSDTIAVSEGNITVDGTVAVSEGNITVDGTVSVPDGPVWDGATNAIRIIAYEHHEVHNGESFVVGLTTVDLDSNPLNISFTTPDSTVWPHITVTAGSSGNATIEIREAPTGGVVGGTDLVPLNRDRNNDVASVMIATHEAVVNEMTQGASAGTGGTLLTEEEIGASKDKVGGTSRGTQEFVLRQNTTYCIRMTSVVNLIRATLQVDWYEHTNL